MFIKTTEKLKLQIRYSVAQENLYTWSFHECFQMVTHILLNFSATLRKNKVSNNLGTLRTFFPDSSYKLLGEYTAQMSGPYESKATQL